MRDETGRVPDRIDLRGKGYCARDAKSVVERARFASYDHGKPVQIFGGRSLDRHIFRLVVLELIGALEIQRRSRAEDIVEGHDERLSLDLLFDRADRTLSTPRPATYLYTVTSLQ